MKATKKQITEVTTVANAMNFSVEKSLHTLSNCSLSIYKAIGAVGVVESSMRVNNEYFVDTLKLSKMANRMEVGINELMTEEEIKINR